MTGEWEDKPLQCCKGWKDLGFVVRVCGEGVKLQIKKWRYHLIVCIQLVLPSNGMVNANLLGLNKTSCEFVVGQMAELQLEARASSMLQMDGLLLGAAGVAKDEVQWVLPAGADEKCLHLNETLFVRWDLPKNENLASLSKRNGSGGSKKVFGDY
ncbi:hypothetical protein BDR07DRAFT_1380454 [Suillus spraguei]|nr:hypothetical protein BDR07DRAFT_1380454 [Suillus spraguei]